MNTRSPNSAFRGKRGNRKGEITLDRSRSRREMKFRKTPSFESLRREREKGRQGNRVGGIAGLGVFFMARYSHREWNLIREWR